MSWSLRLQNGDLALDGTSLGSISGAQKLVQDLRCAILERMGTDDMHPQFGSLIDGGFANGREVPSLLGGNNWDHIALQVESELRRIATDYQRKQLDRIQQDRLTYGSSTLTPSEVLAAISGIRLVQAQDALLVQVSIQTATGEQQTLNLPVSSEPILAT
jgi:hypothetical protein